MVEIFAYSLAVLVMVIGAALLVVVLWKLIRRLFIKYFGD